jgi:hypothetical protein
VGRGTFFIVADLRMNGFGDKHGLGDKYIFCFGSPRFDWKSANPQIRDKKLPLSL